jgi:pyridoxine 5-phosphate synthase
MIAKLGVNIDHVATVRQARGTTYPDPVTAAAVAEMAGADQITVHIRMDRRHIQERDLELLARTVQTKLNVEMAPTAEMLAIAESVQPATVTLVPEREGEVTTEGGLDLTIESVRRDVEAAVLRLRRAGIHPAVFIDPEREQVEACRALGAATVELNTAAYAEAGTDEDRARELDRVAAAAEAAAEAGLYVAAGHGLHYHNIEALVDLDVVSEFNIGHSIVARALFSGLGDAVADMKALL